MTDFSPDGISKCSKNLDSVDVNLEDTDILVVEDNPVNQKLMRMILEKYKSHVTLAKNGKEALQCLKEHKFDLALMDLQMPEMDGITATILYREFERTKKLPPLPIIALTAKTISSDREDCLNAGMNDFLSKPFSQKQLLTILKKHLR